MAVLDLSAHILEYQTTPEGGYFDEETGDYVQASGESSWVECSKCDMVPSGKADTITLPDGQVEPYSYTIYLPKDCRKFGYGDKVRVKLFSNPEEVQEFTVKGFHRYQLQCKMWV